MSDTASYDDSPHFTLLKQLSEAFGVSGDEDAVRALVLDAIRPHVTDLHIDPMGNILAVKRGTGAQNLRVMAAAHMDEVGMMVMGADSDGLIRFTSIGGLDARILPGARVLVGPERVPGVIGFTPIHLNRSQTAVEIDNLRIDIGVSSREAAQRAAERGDRIAFASEYVDLGPTVRCKAFDDRAGCATLIRLVQGEPFPFDLQVAFTVQEEVGLRGAIVAARHFMPDAAFVLETTACHDLPQDPDEPDQTTITRMGEGPAIYVADRTTIYPPRMVQHLVSAAERAGLPHQFRSPQHAGGTDAGVIHQAGTGVLTATISTPCRYLHGPHTLMHKADWLAQHDLLRAAWETLTPGALGLSTSA